MTQQIPALRCPHREIQPEQMNSHGIRLFQNMGQGYPAEANIILTLNWSVPFSELITQKRKKLHKRLDSYEEFHLVRHLFFFFLNLLLILKVLFLTQQEWMDTSLTCSNASASQQAWTGTQCKHSQQIQEHFKDVQYPHSRRFHKAGFAECGPLRTWLPVWGWWPGSTANPGTKTRRNCRMCHLKRTMDFPCFYMSFTKHYTWCLNTADALILLMHWYR